MDKEAKEKRISKEIARIRGIFKGIESERLKVCSGLIQCAGFMKITLEDYEIDLDTNGYTEIFRQSENLPEYSKERPVAKLYNVMNKNYQSIIKQLTDLLPKDAEKEEPDELVEFLKSRGQ